MGHYDCKDCGWPEGIEKGFCKKCTPEEYFKLVKQKHILYAEAKAHAEELTKEEYKYHLEDYLSSSGYYNLKNKMDELLK